MKTRSTLGVIAVALIGLSGCQGQKIVARVKNQTITQDELYERMLTTVPGSIPQQAGMDVGGATLINMIREAMMLQLAEEKKVKPTEESVSKFYAFVKRANPSLDDEIRAGRQDEAEMLRRIRLTLAEFAIGTNGAKVDDKEVQAEFEKSRNEFKISESFTVKSLRVPTEAAGNQALDLLRKTGDFRTAAMQVLNVSGSQLAGAGRETTVPGDKLPKELRDAFAATPVGQYSAKPIEVSAPNPQTQVMEKFFIVAQVVRKTPAFDPKLEDVRAVIEQKLLTQKYPDWQSVKDKTLAEFTRTAAEKKDIQINIKRYQSLLNSFILAQADMRLGPQTPSGGMAPPPGGSGASPAGGAGSPSGGSQ